MLHHLEELRKRPKAIRNSYAFGVALSVTLLVAVVWAVSLPSRFTLESEVATEQPTDSGPTIQEQLSGVRDILSDNLELLQSQAEVIESADQDEPAEVSGATTSTEVRGDTIDSILRATATPTRSLDGSVSSTTR